jgi:hypothetical protein
MNSNAFRFCVALFCSCGLGRGCAVGSGKWPTRSKGGWTRFGKENGDGEERRPRKRDTATPPFCNGHWV